MTYEQLVVLNAIVTEGTFRGAAERLNKSQSAISHMIKKLEEQIDIVLLSRETYRPKLTAQGEVFYRQATRVMQQMQQLNNTAKGLSADHEAEVLIAVTATYPLTNLLKIIGEVSADFPSTHIRLARESMGGPIEQLLRNDADIIVAKMDGVPVEQVEAEPISSVAIGPVAHPDFEPSRTKHMKTISEMQSYVQVVVADSSSGAFEQSRGLLPGGLRWTVSDFITKKEILMAKMGWGGIPDHLIVDEIASGELVYLNVEGYPLERSSLYKIRRRDRTFGIVAQAIWERMTAEDN